MATALTLISRDPDAWIEREISRSLRLKSINTRRGYIADLKGFNAWRNGRPMTKLLVEEYAAELQADGHAPNTINRILSAVRWWARRLGDLAYEDRSLDPAEREEITTQASRVAAIENVKGKRLPKGRHINPGELVALLRACAEDESPAGVRDAAIFALAAATGARRSELASLTLADYKHTTEAEAEVVIHGKGDKVRRVPLANGAVDAVDDWIALRGHKPGLLFYAINKSGKIVRTERAYGIKGQKGRGKGEMHEPGLSDEALAQMLDRRALEAAIAETLTWHDFRRTFAGNQLDAGTDLATVQKLMGHSSPITTSNYDRRGDEVLRKAARTVFVPYHRRGK